MTRATPGDVPLAAAGDAARPRRGLSEVVPLFVAFAFSYFLSALLRGVTATLAPVFSAELGLGAADLGLLAGAYFFGFACLQLPLGRALDRHGPRRALLVLLTLAVGGCVAFSLAQGLAGLIAARALIGAGVAACLMAPLACFAGVLSRPAQLRANSWLLMSGSLGMLASTLPVQGLLPMLGWRGLFVALAAALAAAMAVLAWQLPRQRPAASAAASGSTSTVGGYREIFSHPLFIRVAPIGFFVYGGLIAVQSLWAGPWMTRVGGAGPAQAAQGLFGINVAMLIAFMLWGLCMPRLARRGVGALQLITWGLPLCLMLLAVNIALGPAAGAAAWAVWCVACSVVSLSQPAVGQAFAPELAGRALSAFNLVIFSGVFSVQWGIGLTIDAFGALGCSEPVAFQSAFALFAACSLCAYVWFLQRGPASGR
jgi:predicted MFS family arabinose efflux permease